MHPPADDLLDPGPPAATLFRSGLTWLRDTGVASRGRKAKRRIHRADRKAAREQLRKIYPA